jgi:hypothetical protein
MTNEPLLLLIYFLHSSLLQFVFCTVVPDDYKSKDDEIQGLVSAFLNCSKAKLSTKFSKRASTQILNMKP